MKLANYIPLLGLFILTASTTYGQHEETHAPAAHAVHSLKGSHRFSFGLGHTHISEGKIQDKTEWLTLASFSLNYDYWLSDHFALGLQSDMVLEEFFIRAADDMEIERSYPVTLAPVGIYKIGKHLGLIGGVGLEITKEDNLALTRLGFEYGFHVPGDWEISLEAVWDVKWDYYDSWLMGFTVSKILPGGKGRAHPHESE